MKRKRNESGTCSCGLFRKSLHFDHIIPRWKDGSDDPSNIQRICANCHEDKTREDMKGKPNGREGLPCSPETRAAISAAQKGRAFTPEHLANLRAANKTRKLSGPFTAEHCANIGAGIRATYAARRVLKISQSTSSEEN